MGASLDTRRAHAVRQHGDIIAIYTWVNDERALVLLPAYRKGAPWYVVCESAAFRYDNPHYLARQAAKAAEVLGFESSQQTWMRIATIIHEGLPDLIRMPGFQPPEPKGAAYGQMVLRADGKPIAAQDLRNTPEGVTYG